MNDAASAVLRATALAVALAIAAPILAEADEQASPPPLQLRAIMQQLGRDMQEVVDAISREDWARVATLAPRIASHGQPPVAEKAKILGWVGRNAPAFRAHDGAVRDAALGMGEAAARADGAAVIESFSKLQRGCLACHQQFRAGFVEHFYGRN